MLMKEILDIISNNMFDCQSIDIDNNIDIIDNLNKAKIFCFQQYALDTVWLDLKESKSLSLKFSSEEDEDYWADNMSEKIEYFLSESIYSEFIDEIDNDLFNCYINKKYNINDDFWNLIFSTYKTKLFPCGWNGVFPNGKLIVFRP